MKVVIAGGHGKIALRLTRLLADRPDTASRIYVVVGGKTPIEQAIDV
jgi:hypothetical protein